MAAHGTGASLPTVEEMILRMKLVTPASGTMELSATQGPELFQLAKARDWGMWLKGVYL